MVRARKYIGNSLKTFGIPRDKVVLASKVFSNDGRLKKEAILQEIDGTLKRLETDYLHLYYIHLLDYDTPIEETIEASSGGTSSETPSIQFLTTNGGATIPLSDLAHRTDLEKAPVVYYISDITPESLVETYNVLGWTSKGNVAVKLSTGEPPASNCLRHELIKNLVQMVNGTIIECNTVYGGSRAVTAAHYQVAKKYGFTDIANFQILDENGSMSIPVKNGTRLDENYVGAAFGDYKQYI